jgi:hypothetical protein
MKVSTISILVTVGIVLYGLLGCTTSDGDPDSSTDLKEATVPLFRLDETFSAQSADVMTLAYPGFSDINEFLREAISPSFKGFVTDDVLAGDSEINISVGGEMQTFDVSEQANGYQYQHIDGDFELTVVTDEVNDTFSLVESYIIDYSDVDGNDWSAYKYLITDSVWNGLEVFHEPYTLKGYNDVRDLLGNNTTGPGLFKGEVFKNETFYGILIRGQVWMDYDVGDPKIPTTDIADALSQIDEASDYRDGFLKDLTAVAEEDNVILKIYDADGVVVDDSFYDTDDVYNTGPEAYDNDSSATVGIDLETTITLYFPETGWTLNIQ